MPLSSALAGVSQELASLSMSQPCALRGGERGDREIDVTRGCLQLFNVGFFYLLTVCYGSGFNDD